MPTAVPAAAFSAIWLTCRVGVRRRVEGDRLRAVEDGEGEVWVAVLLSDEVAVTVRVIEVSVSKSSVPVPERVMTPVSGVDGKARVVDAVGHRVEPASGSLAEAVMPDRAGGGKLGDLVGGRIGIGRIVEDDRIAEQDRQLVFDMQQRRGGGPALIGIGGARAGAGDQERHVVERRPARAVDDLLHDRREVRRALGEAGLAACRPARRCQAADASVIVREETLKLTAVKAPASSVSSPRISSEIAPVFTSSTRELDVGTGDDRALGNVDAGEADPDRLLLVPSKVSSRSELVVATEPVARSSASSGPATTLASKIAMSVCPFCLSLQVL